MSLFSEYFCTVAVSLSHGENTSYVFPFRVVFFYLVITGWIFGVSVFYENSTNQPIIQGEMFRAKSIVQSIL